MSKKKPKKKSKSKPKYKREHRSIDAILVTLGDMHTNSVSGLIPPIVYTSGGGEYHANAYQSQLWEWYLDFCNQIQEIKRLSKLPVVTVLNGDTVDKNKYAPHELIDLNPTVILDTGVEVLDPILSVSDFWYVIRGTPSHTGKGAWLEERLAKEIGAQPSGRVGPTSAWVWSWWTLYIELAGGITFDIKHRPESRSMRTWTLGGGAMRIAKTVCDNYDKTDTKPPNIVIRNHYHHWEDSGTNYKARAFMLPAWQGPTDFTQSIGLDPEAHEFGGMYFTCKNNSFSPWSDIRYMFDRKPPERIGV